MLDTEYLTRLPKNQLLAADKLCTDFLAGKFSKDDPGDVAHVLEVLLEDRLPEGWDGDLDSIVAQTATFFRAETPGTRLKARITLIHRHVKAMAAKATITEPCLINTFLIEVPEAEKKESNRFFEQARSKLREIESNEAAHQKAKRDSESDEQVLQKAKRDEESDKEAQQKLTKAILALQAEAEKKYSDFRVFIDHYIVAAENATALGPEVKPVFELIKRGFAVVDRRRKELETREVPQPRIALPSPASPQ